VHAHKKDAYKDAHTARGAAAIGHVVGVGRIRMRPSLGAQMEARTAPGRRKYIACLPHLKSPSLLLLVPCLAPAKSFAWDFGS
jgi:hypothetical protein